MTHFLPAVSCVVPLMKFYTFRYSSTIIDWKLKIFLWTTLLKMPLTICCRHFFWLLKHAGLEVSTSSVHAKHRHLT